MAKHSRHRRSTAPDPKTQPGRSLLGPGGKVDPAAVFRAARAGADAPPPPAPPITLAEEGVEDDEQLAECALPSGSPSPPAASPPSARAAPPRDEPAPRDSAESASAEVTFSRAAPPGQAQRIVFTLQRDLDKRLDKYLVDRITFMSRSKLQALIDEGAVRVNGRVAKASTNLRAGDSVEVLVPPPPSEDFEPQDIPLDVLFEDEHLIVINKQADLIVHPARTHVRGTMINALAFHFRNRSRFGGTLSAVGGEFARPGVVHRLDRFTTGVIVFAKSDQAHWRLANQFMARTVDKRYVALAHGRVEPTIDSIDVPLGPHPSREKGYREKQVVRHDALGKPALTIYRVLGVYPVAAAARVSTSAPKPPPGWDGPWFAPPAAHEPASAGPDSGFVSLVEVELKTGRTHQIRVHFAHLGWPLVGDDMYGGRILELAHANSPPQARTSRGTKPRRTPTAPAPAPITVARQALHAAMLTFRHPLSDKPMRFVAPLPHDLRSAIAALRTLDGARENPNVPGSVLTLDELVPAQPPARAK